MGRGWYVAVVVVSVLLGFLSWFCALALWQYRGGRATDECAYAVSIAERMGIPVCGVGT